MLYCLSILWCHLCVGILGSFLSHTGPNSNTWHWESIPKYQRLVSNKSATAVWNYSKNLESPKTKMSRKWQKWRKFVQRFALCFTLCLNWASFTKKNKKKMKTFPESEGPPRSTWGSVKFSFEERALKRHLKLQQLITFENEIGIQRCRSAHRSDVAVVWRSSVWINNMKCWGFKGSDVRSCLGWHKHYY